MLSNARFGRTHFSLQVGPFKMVRFPIDLARRWINSGIYGCSSKPKNFVHHPANQFARSPKIKQNSNTDPDNRLPDKCAHAGIDIRQNVHELFFGLEICVIHRIGDIILSQSGTLAGADWRG